MIGCRRASALVVLVVGLGIGVARADVATAPDAATDTAIHAALDQRLRQLAQRHYLAGEYYRAISAYEELALFGDPATARFAAIRIAMSYHRGHQLDDALAAYRRAIDLVERGDADTAQALRIQLAAARAERSLAQPGSDALDVIGAELAPITAAGRYRTFALAELARIDGLAGKLGDARRAANELAALCLTPAPGCDLAPRLARALDPRVAPPVARRSLWLGLAMSLVVPGAGSVYGGRLVDGAYAFALTALSGLGAYDVYDGGRRFSDQKAAFYGLATLGAVFYAGSALQGYIAVVRHNAIAELDARRALWAATATPLPLDVPGP